MSLLNRVETFAKNDIQKLNKAQREEAKSALNTALENSVDGKTKNEFIGKKKNIIDTLNASFLVHPFLLAQNKTQLWWNDALTDAEKINATARFLIFAPTAIVLFIFIHACFGTNPA